VSPTLGVTRWGGQDSNLRPTDYEFVARAGATCGFDHERASNQHFLCPTARRISGGFRSVAGQTRGVSLPFPPASSPMGLLAHRCATRRSRLSSQARGSSLRSGPIGSSQRRFRMPRTAVQSLSEGDWGFGPLQAYGGTCGDPTGTNGNISADPLFVDRKNSDYHPWAGSPSIDAGDNTAPDLPATDFDGDQRIINGQVDQGVDEPYRGRSGDRDPARRRLARRLLLRLHPPLVHGAVEPGGAADRLPRATMADSTHTTGACWPDLRRGRSRGSIWRNGPKASTPRASRRKDPMVGRDTAQGSASRTPGPVRAPDTTETRAGGSSTPGSRSSRRSSSDSSGA
jgi:hypothetical protein